MSCSARRATLPHTRLSDWTTLRVGGPANSFVEVPDVPSLADALHEAEAADEPVLVLGGGSNVVVADAGFPGTVVHVAIEGVRLEPEGAGVIARVGAGEDWCGFVTYCVAEGLAGVECLSGIPGLAGATPVQNVGAYGQDVSETIAGVTVWDRELRSPVQMAPDECGFALPRQPVQEEPSLRRDRSGLQVEAVSVFDARCGTRNWPAGWGPRSGTVPPWKRRPGP